MKRATFLLAVAIIACIAVGRPAFADLVNGGFETGDFTGWTLAGNTDNTAGVFSGHFGVNPHSGSYQAYFRQIGSFASTSQNTPAGSYDLSFWLYNFAGQ